MATRKTKTPRAKVSKMTKEVPVKVVETPVKSGNQMNFLAKVMLVVIVGVALFMLANKYRGLVLAGIVNKTPITRFQLNQAMAKRYGKTTFDEIVSNTLIKEEAKKMGLEVSQQEVAEEIASLQEKIGGEEALADALVQYGLTRDELEDQIEVSVLQRKIAEKLENISVTEEEADEYFKANAESYEGEKFDDVKEDIITLLKEQKMQLAFSTWFAEVKANAQIKSYLD